MSAISTAEVEEARHPLRDGPANCTTPHRRTPGTAVPVRLPDDARVLERHVAPDPGARALFTSTTTRPPPGCSLSASTSRPTPCAPHPAGRCAGPGCIASSRRPTALRPGAFAAPATGTGSTVATSLAGAAPRRQAGQRPLTATAGARRLREMPSDHGEVGVAQTHHRRTVPPRAALLLMNPAAAPAARAARDPTAQPRHRRRARSSSRTGRPGDDDVGDSRRCRDLGGSD